MKPTKYEEADWCACDDRPNNRAWCDTHLIVLALVTFFLGLWIGMIVGRLV